MKRIMFMTNALYGGGAEKVLQTILSNLDREKYEITLYSMHNEVIDYDYYPKDVKYRAVFNNYKGHCPVFRLLSYIYTQIEGILFLYAPMWMFYKLYIHGQYDVEVAFIEGEATKIISGSTSKYARKIAWVHVDLIANPWTDFLYESVSEESKVYSKYDKIFCVSNGVKQSFVRKYMDRS